MSASTTILVLSDNSGEDYVSRIVTGVRRSAQAAGCAVRSINIFGSSKKVEDVLEVEDFGGIILTPPLSDERYLLSILEAKGIPMVRIAPLLDIERGSTVGMDEFQAASDAVALLTARGHRRIGIVRGPKSHLVSMRRYNGYINAIGAKGVRVNQALVAQGDFTRESGKQAGPTLFAEKPTAIFASNDEMAAGIVDAARAAGIAVPGELSVVGFDDNAIATRVSPHLTTIRQPCEAMGDAAGRILADQLKARRKGREHVTVPYEVIERQSVADPREG